MWIEERQTKKGLRYRYNERYTDSKGRTKKISITLNSNSRIAQNTASRLLYEKIAQAQEQEKEDKEITFARVATEWQEHAALSVKPMTAVNHKLHVKKALAILPDGAKLADLTAVDIEKAMYELYYNGSLTYGYCHAVLQTIKRIYKYAKRRRLISDIADILEVELNRKPYTASELVKKKEKFLDHDELRECLRQLHQLHKPIALMMEFISRTGLRCSELLALRVQDYDKENRRIHINGTIIQHTSVNSNVVRGTPKNIYSVRYVALDSRSVSILDSFILENKKRALWFKGYDDKGYIFTTNRGNPYNLQYIGHYLRRLQIEGKHVTTHIFRHTHISILAELGIPLKAIMQRVGHNDPKTTLSIYTHVTENMQNDVINKLEKCTL
ncbi:tyrosine-type recombinase/integrase [Veillonella magna]|uniref:tyrosine-type recombinase/integrase n=1 Tax=Veillonella magna TaxID=464322 RepID=UPI0026DD87B4|nr:site-specific integrase [Veillonella magna]